MKKHIHVSLVSGLVGMVIGAGSLYLAEEASIIKIHPAAPAHITTRDSEDAGIQNQRSTGNRVDVARPTKTLP
jgi:hypothetical protein